MILAMMLAAAVFTPAPDTKWQIDYGEDKCRLLRPFSDGKQTIVFGISQTGHTENSNSAFEVFIDSKAPLLQRPMPELRAFAHAQIDIDRRRAAWVGAAEFRQVANGTTMISFEYNLSEAIPQLFDAKSLIMKAYSFEFAVEPDLPSGGIKALRACTDDMLRSWGVDPAERQAVLTEAKLQNVSFTPKIKPSADMLKNSKEPVGMIVTVGLDGRSTDCRVVVSSGLPELDAMSCAMISERARYAPARGNDKMPVVSHFFQQIDWRANQFLP